MSRPRLLDLFCGAGGCSVGYHRAGFDVVGIDNRYHEDYPDPSHGIVPSATAQEHPCQFLVGDALNVLQDRQFLAGFDVVHASPPCPAYSTITPDPSAHPELIEPVRELLRAWGGVYVIENVQGAARAMPDAVMLCGSSFGLRVRRHRLFESNVPLAAPACRHDAQGTPVGVYGNLDRQVRRRPDGTRRGDKAISPAEGRAAMGIDWMSWDDLTDAIPPTYTEHLGTQLLAALQRGVA